MRLSAPLHTSLHPINRHTAGAAGKLIFLLFFPLFPSLLPYPTPFPPPPAVALPELRAVSPRGVGCGLGLSRAGPAVLGTMAEPPVLPQQPGTLWSLSPTGRSVPAARVKVAEQRFLLSLVGSGALKDALATAL